MPEFPAGTRITTAQTLLRTLFDHAGLDSARYGATEWNPLGDLIRPGDKVLLKPNWVMHRNSLPGETWECLVTHPSVIEAVLDYVVKTCPGEIIVGDAPVQDCDFVHLCAACNLDEMAANFRRLGHVVGLRDFRMTKRPRGIYGKQVSLCRSVDQYCLFDLGESSWLAPITTENSEFRVANYNPHILGMHHRAGVHRYLVAREVMDADVVISLPKLKTHKKAAVTGALKNMVGINGFKEYLPHHRKGGADSCGDCYEKGGRLKSFAEDSLDRANLRTGLLSRYFHYRLAGLATRLDAVFFGNDRNLEGAWRGNDTVWRMCLDLQRILHYGKSDGSIANAPQRKVITITDAIVAGDGDGPLAPSPVPLGVMTFGLNVAALEWVHCLLMRMKPERIPLVAHAFAKSDWPLANFSPDQIVVHVNGDILPDLKSLAKFSRSFSAPSGWRGHCEETDL